MANKKDKEQRIEELKNKIAFFESEYMHEVSKLAIKPGFDIEQKEWNDKVKAIAKKYAQYVLPFENELEKLTGKSVFDD